MRTQAIKGYFRPCIDCQEFLADMVLPDGRTMGEWAKPALKEAYDKGGDWQPPRLGGGGGDDG